jgi:hypothetical protein
MRFSHSLPVSLSGSIAGRLVDESRPISRQPPISSTNCHNMKIGQHNNFAQWKLRLQKIAAVTLSQ